MDVVQIHVLNSVLRMHINLSFLWLSIKIQVMVVVKDTGYACEISTIYACNTKDSSARHPNSH